MKSLKETILDLYVTVLIKHKHILEGKQHEEYPKRYQVRTLLLKAIENAKHLDHLEFCKNYLNRFEAKIVSEDPYIRFMLQAKIHELSNIEIVENKENNFKLENNKITIQPSWCGPYIH
jgi:hypothetical protein